jgi:hypothetical protein
VGRSSRIDTLPSTRGRVSGMTKKVVPLPPRRATPMKTVSERQSRVAIRLGKQRYALDITCQASVLPPEPEPASRLIETKLLRLRQHALDITCQASVLPPEPEPASRLIETKLLRLRQPATLGDRIDGWRVCWVGGWDRGKIFFVVMVSRSLYVTQHK